MIVFDYDKKMKLQVYLKFNLIANTQYKKSLVRFLMNPFRPHQSHVKQRLEGLE
jgi:hypothetical protein